jgi:hypothetical protein
MDPAIKKIKRDALLIRRINLTHIFFFWNTGAGWIPCWVTEKTSAYIPIPRFAYIEPLVSSPYFLFVASF